MYTLLFLLIALCVLATFRDWSRRARLLMWSATLVLSVLAFVPHILAHTFHLAL
ncbi:hypothetical protein ACFU90_22815 [Streptomyces noursei]|uniref:Uncharacterized protein n=1 Tax=Streptomyces noursei TaxID=1971 RepID=A0A059W0V0_STRNR|nr:hypothetical protein [Streptomyces noursei]AKA08484.1 hypothetical protein SAZ_05190 [Streptomyces noursei ZPM]AIA01466.1 hypothetical protein DC74_946 [Streptomyces noursei]EPY93278.1 hypothetical protein K530_48820 [Streptomyces noursei CCRC 11814]MCZ0970423.1 hypothetical protein [Streptomyces noursei]UWS70370.1 hypothetical protein N1H47_03460 [Streptomyces noursei]